MIRNRRKFLIFLLLIVSILSNGLYIQYPYALTPCIYTTACDVIKSFIIWEFLHLFVYVLQLFQFVSPCGIH